MITPIITIPRIISNHLSVILTASKAPSTAPGMVSAANLRPKFSPDIFSLRNDKVAKRL